MARQQVTGSNHVTQDDITDRLDRAQALAYVLADAAGGNLGVEPENVHQVGLAIADGIRQAQELLARYLDDLSRQTKDAA